MAGLSPFQRQALEAAGCEVRWDDLTRRLYATDASIYQVEPLAVALPRTTLEAARVVAAAADAGVAVAPRGAGTGLAGGALGEGLVLELARCNRGLCTIDPDTATVTVGAGVVLDRLNAALAPHGLWFGPDVATSSRATLGGMIANNSSGAHAPVYGTTAEHVVAVEVVLADGRVATVGAGHQDLADLAREAGRIVAGCSEAIRERLPQGLVKRWPGYGFDRYLHDPEDLSRLVAGSEGTLAVVTSAVLRAVPRPRRRVLGVVFFASVEEALQATVELLDLEPAAIEHIDRLVLDQTRGQLAFAAARSLLRLDEEPCQSLLLVEFFEQVDAKLETMRGRRLGLGTQVFSDPTDQELVWGLRRSGLSLLTSCPGPAKPVAGIEDVCVRPRVLPEYVAGLRELLGPLGLEASLYGHAASGELHVRPKLDLHTAEDVAKLRHIGDGVSELCRRFRSSLAAEHGVGIARTEYLPVHLGEELMEATRRVKRLFDPGDVLNPGKIVDNGRYRIDRDLRQGAGYKLELPFAPVIGFVERDHGLVANLEQCNGCGGCRKDAPTMCPTFIATGEELLSTRGRANVIRAVLEGRFEPGGDPVLLAAELEEALGNCVACKACKRECPSNVDLALLKAELLHARHQLRGPGLLDRAIAAADTLGRLGCALAPLANVMLGWRPLRVLLQRVLGLDASRSLPAYARQRFDRWFSRRSPAPRRPRGRVILWDDTWVRYHEPEVGRAAVAVLERAGFDVGLVEARQCCGRPACSRGLLDEVRHLGEHNLRLLTGGDEAIVFLEPSCYSMFVDEYRQLGLAGADEVAARCVLFEQLMDDLLESDPEALGLVDQGLRVVVHAHCHATSLTDSGVMMRVVDRIPGAEGRMLDSGCCGMAGAFGMLATKQELSLAMARPLVETIASLPDGTRLVASGTSCRHQIRHLAGFQPLHMAELVAAAIEHDD